MAKRSAKSVHVHDHKISSSRFAPGAASEDRPVADERQIITVPRRGGSWEEPPPMAPALREVRDCIVAAADAVLSVSCASGLSDLVIEVDFAKPVAVKAPDFTMLAALVGAAFRSSTPGGNAVRLGSTEHIEVYIKVSTSDRKMWHDREVEPLSECIRRIEALSELKMPRSRPPEFLELEELIRSAQAADGATAAERERLTNAINLSLETLDASLRLPSGEIVHRLNYQPTSKTGTVVFAVPGAGMRGFRKNPVEVIHSPSSRH